MADLPAPIGPSAPTTRKSEGLTRMDERGRGGERETRKSDGLTRMVKKWHELFCYLKKNHTGIC